MTPSSFLPGCTQYSDVKKCHGITSSGPHDSCCTYGHTHTPMWHHCSPQSVAAYGVWQYIEVVYTGFHVR
jgi:hypothetical protein